VAPASAVGRTAVRAATVEILDVPKTSTGKVQMKELRDEEWEGRDRGVGRPSAALRRDR
jgi:hypothetical protein